VRWMNLNACDKEAQRQIKALETGKRGRNFDGTHNYSNAWHQLCCNCNVIVLCKLRCDE
jgi:hypothetical protein